MFVVYSRIEFTQRPSMCYKPTDQWTVTSAKQDRIERVTVKPLQINAKFPLLYIEVKVSRPSQCPPSSSFHLIPHSRAMSASPSREHSSDFEMRWTGQLLSTKFGVSGTPRLLFCGILYQDTPTDGETLGRDFKFYPSLSTEVMNARSIISNTLSSCCGAQLFTPSGNFAFIYILTFSTDFECNFQPTLRPAHPHSLDHHKRFHIRPIWTVK